MPPSSHVSLLEKSVSVNDEHIQTSESSALKSLTEELTSLFQNVFAMTS